MICAIIQARLGSKRLPQKILMEVAPNTNLLQMVVRRVKKAKLVDKVIVALAHDSKSVIPIVENEGVAYSWWPDDTRDVLGEYFWAASKHGADTIVRITADCPFVDPNIIDKMILMHKESNCGLTYNHNDNYTGAGVEIDGIDTEICSYGALYLANQQAKDKSEREHLTKWMYSHVSKHRVEQGWTDHILWEWIDGGQIKLSVNTQEQLDRVRKIISVLGVDFHTKQLIEYMSKNKP